MYINTKKNYIRYQAAARIQLSSKEEEEEERMQVTVSQFPPTVRYICPKRPIKETYIWGKRHKYMKEIYLYVSTRQLPPTVRYICQKRPIKRDLYAQKRDICMWKQTKIYERDLYIRHRKTVLLNCPVNMSKETYKRDLYT